MPFNLVIKYQISRRRENVFYCYFSVAGFFFRPCGSFSCETVSTYEAVKKNIEGNICGEGLANLKAGFLFDVRVIQIY